MHALPLASLLVIGTPPARAASAAPAKTARWVNRGRSTVKAGPDQLQLRPGDTTLEGETLVLHPYNAGTKPVVILVASLLQAGKPQSVSITQSVVVPPMSK